MEYKCSECKNLFIAKAYPLRKFCSRLCFRASRRGKPVKEMNFSCALCGKRYRVKPSHLARRRYCSNTCLSSALKGKSIAWFTGKPFSEEHRKNLSLSHMGGKSHLGIKHTEETKMKISAANQGVSIDDWSGFKRNQNYLDRRSFRTTIQRQVFERDDYTCQLCGQKGVALQVDHIQSWKEYVELRFCIDNCRTLCMGCHYQITFGRPIPSSVKTWGHNLNKSTQKGGGEV